jgi:hypothetical protein
VYQNCPNSSITVRFSVPGGTRPAVFLRVHDVSGREVATLLHEEQQPGTYEVTWDARGVAGSAYFYTLRSCGFRSMKTLLLIE